MGQALVVNRAFKQNLAGGGFEALAAATGSTLGVPDFAAGTRAWMLEAWGANSAHGADFDLRSPDFHDNTRGIRVAYAPKPAVGNPQLFLPGVVKQQLYKTDVMTAEVSGTAADNVGFQWLSYFENLEGAQQTLMTWDEVQASMKDVVGIFVNATAGAAGDFGAARLLNADDDRLIAGHKYALLGIVGQLPCECIAITGPETSNRPIGCPILVGAHTSGSFFADLSAKYQLPLIPVFNGSNKATISVQAADCNGATVPHAVLIFGDLGS